MAARAEVTEMDVDIHQSRETRYVWLVNAGKLERRYTSWQTTFALFHYMSSTTPSWTRILEARNGTAFVCPSIASGLPVRQYPDLDTAIAAAMLIGA